MPRPEMLGTMSIKVMQIHGKIVEDRQENHPNIDPNIILNLGWWIQETQEWIQGMIQDMIPGKDRVNVEWLITRVQEKGEDQEARLPGHEATGKCRASRGVSAYILNCCRRLFLIKHFHAFK